MILRQISLYSSATALAISLSMMAAPATAQPGMGLPERGAQTLPPVDGQSIYFGQSFTDSLPGAEGAFPIGLNEGATEAQQNRRRRSRRRRRDRIDAGDVVAGVLVIGGIAAIANAASRSSREARNERRYPRQTSTRYSNANQHGVSRAINACLGQIERDVRVEEISNVGRSAQGWNVQGRLYNAQGFACQVDDQGRVQTVQYGGAGNASYGVDGGPQGGYSQGGYSQGGYSQGGYPQGSNSQYSGATHVPDRQWSAAQYAEARQVADAENLPFSPNPQYRVAQGSAPVRQAPTLAQPQGLAQNQQFTQQPNQQFTQQPIQQPTRPQGLPIQYEQVPQPPLMNENYSRVPKPQPTQKAPYIEAQYGGSQYGGSQYGGSQYAGQQLQKISYQSVQHIEALPNYAAAWEEYAESHGD